MLAVLLFAVAVSVDGFLAGIAHGMRGIRVPIATLIIINVISGVVVFLSLSSGDYIANQLGLQAAKIAGSSILIILGVLMLKPLSKPGIKDPIKPKNCSGDIFKNIADDNPVNIFTSRIGVSGFFRLITMIPKFLVEPATADLDSSGVLTPDEGFLLGVALAVDAFGVGFGAGMSGISRIATPIIAGITQCIFVSFGLILGRNMRRTVSVRVVEKVPGVMLIFLGMLRLK
ncbi:MAG: hypothetical protein GX969_03235 [Firmicutes bacterium]|nr:hypothetical protein [Bacillota bacterium]